MYLVESLSSGSNFSFIDIHYALRMNNNLQLLVVIIRPLLRISPDFTGVVTFFQMIESKREI